MTMRIDYYLSFLKKKQQEEHKPNFMSSVLAVGIFFKKIITDLYL